MTNNNELFSDWWPTFGLKLTEDIFTGMIADDRQINDTIIQDPEQMSKFKECIALNILKKEPNQKFKRAEYVANRDDVFLNDKILIDYFEYIVILITSAEINEIYYSSLYEAYMIELTRKSVDSKFYSAGIIKRIESCSKFILINPKPPSLINKRPEVNNDEY
jgi:hypothetical protein